MNLVIVKYANSGYRVFRDGLQPAIGEFGSAAEAESWAEGYEAGYKAHIAETTPKPLGELLSEGE